MEYLPSESKPNVTPLTVLAHVLCAIKSYAHLLYVQRLIPHQPSQGSCLHSARGELPNPAAPGEPLGTPQPRLEPAAPAEGAGAVLGVTAGLSSAQRCAGFALLCSSSPLRKARALYACKAEHDSELSFTAGTVFDNVHPSQEPGWLEGTLNGKTGLIPENYVEFL
ncbi:hypothetical protein DV515_00006690 [Chloebia gouldiae]|uniref:SH3 domain-containing protein n=1 Tax=Chloebia gouldiae TaxID=44316 RepID=A0A3L8SK78_CHLGU|nr:hypothetical protein DV515_00006690 [Chloebia gouldiae]